MRESLVERAQLLKAAPHLVTPLRFLLPIYRWQRRQALDAQGGACALRRVVLWRRLAGKRQLDDDDIAQLPRLRQEELISVLHYCDCMTDDAQIDARRPSRCARPGCRYQESPGVTAIAAPANGYAVELDERGRKRRVEARFIVNAAGPFVAGIDAMTSAAPPARALRLVRGSHIVLPMPAPGSGRRLYASGRRGAGRFRPALARPAVPDRRHDRHSAMRAIPARALLGRGDGLSARRL